MGIVGRYIDSLTDEQRDQVVTAQRWCVGHVGEEGSPRCLVGHAGYSPWLVEEFGSIGGPGKVGMKFDYLAYRFGLDRVVRACKTRAGASLPDMGAQVPEEAAQAGSLKL